MSAPQASAAPVAPADPQHPAVTGEAPQPAAQPADASAPAPALNPAAPDVHVAASPKPRAKAAHKAPVDTSEIFGSSVDQWISERNVLMSIDNLEIDVGIAMGQVRSLQADIVAERIADLTLLPPAEPLPVTVWNPSIAEPGV